MSELKVFNCPFCGEKMQGYVQPEVRVRSGVYPETHIYTCSSPSFNHEPENPKSCLFGGMTLSKEQWKISKQTWDDLAGFTPD